MGPVGQGLTLEMVYQVPEAFAEDRSRRSERRVDLPITVRVWLTPGAQRVDFETTVENRACDHRLRVHFPVPFAAERVWVEGHWDVVEWTPVAPAGGSD